MEDRDLDPQALDDRAIREADAAEAEALMSKADLDSKDEMGMYGESPVEYSTRMLEQALIEAVDAMIQTCRYAENEKLRFEAAKYILDRGFGTTSPNGGRFADTDDPLFKLLEKVMDKPKSN
jgi:hypothetical protein